MYKVIFLLVCVVAVCLHGVWSKPSPRAEGHDYIEGEIHDGDVLLYRQEVALKHAVGYVEGQVDYPSADNNGTVGTITFIQALDQWNDGTGGYAEKTAGGVGDKHASVHVKSQLGRGLDFIVSFYGYY